MTIFRWIGIFAVMAMANQWFGLDVVSAAEYEELRYDDLVQRLREKPNVANLVNDGGLNEIQLHAGLGFVSGFSSVKPQNTDTVKTHNGLEVSLGVDLLDPSWQSHFVFTNFGQTKSGTETRSLRAFSFRVSHIVQNVDKGKIRAGVGLGNRYLKISDPSADIYFDETTPFIGLQLAFVGELTKNVSMILEARGETAMSTRTIDKNSMTVAFGIESSF